MEDMEGVHGSGDLFHQEPTKEEKNEVSSMRHLSQEIPIAIITCVARRFLVPVSSVHFHAVKALREGIRCSLPTGSFYEIPT